jgi:hypothetical protein
VSETVTDILDGEQLLASMQGPSDPQRQVILLAF